MQAVAVPHSSLFDILLIVHVLLGLLSLVVLLAMYGSLAGLQRGVAGASWPGGPVRFFAPGREIGGRILYLISISGFALLSASHGDSTLHDSFVQIGLGCWVVSVLVAELLVFPATQRLRQLMVTSPVVPSDEEWRVWVSRARWALDGVVVALVAGAAVMLIQP